MFSTCPTGHNTPSMAANLVPYILGLIEFSKNSNYLLPTYVLRMWTSQVVCLDCGCQLSTTTHMRVHLKAQRTTPLTSTTLPHFTARFIALLSRAARPGVLPLHHPRLPGHTGGTAVHASTFTRGRLLGAVWWLLTQYTHMYSAPSLVHQVWLQH